MKRFATGLLALAIALTPAAAFAEGNDNATEQTTTTNTTEEKPETPQTETGKGENTQQPGNETKDGDNTQQPGNDSKDGETGNKDDDQKEEPAGEPAFVTDVISEDGKIRVIGEIKNAKKVEGFWFAAMGNDDVGLVAVKEGEINGTRFETEFDLTDVEPGTYEVYVGFYGEVDGEEMGFEDLFEVEVVEEDGKDGKEEKPSAKPGDKGEPAKKTKPGVVKEKQNEAKGGKLPKTATTYPTGAAAGLALLLGGLALLKLRRTA